MKSSTHRRSTRSRTGWLDTGAIWASPYHIHIISYHIISYPYPYPYHIISYHIISYHIIHIIFIRRKQYNSSADWLHSPSTSRTSTSKTCAKDTVIRSWPTPLNCFQIAVARRSRNQLAVPWAFQSNTSTNIRRRYACIARISHHTTQNLRLALL